MGQERQEAVVDHQVQEEEAAGLLGMQVVGEEHQEDREEEEEEGEGHQEDQEEEEGHQVHHQMTE